jgi:hypothetical protein
MATSGINAENLEAALYKALYPREAGEYPWERMKTFALTADDVDTYSSIVVKAVRKVAGELLKDSDTRYRSPETGQ